MHPSIPETVSDTLSQVPDTVPVSPQCVLIQGLHYASTPRGAHVSAAKGEVRAKRSLFLKMQQGFYYFTHTKLSPNDLLLMLK